MAIFFNVTATCGNVTATCGST